VAGMFVVTLSGGYEIGEVGCTASRRIEEPFGGLTLWPSWNLKSTRAYARRSE